MLILVHGLSKLELGENAVRKSRQEDSAIM